MRLLGCLGCLLVPLVTLPSCAVADTRLDDGQVLPVDGGGTGDAHVDGGNGKDTGSTSGDTGSGGKDTGSGGSDSGGGSDTGGGSDSGGSDTGTDSGGGTCITADVSLCSSATTMGGVSGDTGAVTKTATGSNGQWLVVTITEDDSSLFTSKDLKVQITLDSPTGENFDLYVYEGKTVADGGGIECSTVAGSSTLSSSSDVVNLGWSDKRPIGGSDDTRTISIEVRPAGEPCDPSATWTVTVAGNK